LKCRLLIAVVTICADFVAKSHTKTKGMMLGAEVGAFLQRVCVCRLVVIIDQIVVAKDCE